MVFQKYLLVGFDTLLDTSVHHQSLLDVQDIYRLSANWTRLFLAVNSRPHSDPIIPDANRTKRMATILYGNCFIQKTGANLATKCLIKALEILRNVAFQKDDVFIHVIASISFGHCRGYDLFQSIVESLAHPLFVRAYLELRQKYHCLV